jgi:hypothetical protein
MMSKAIILLIILVVGLFTLMLVEVQTANAQYTQNGAGCPLVSGIGITFPSNTTYSSNLLTLNINIESIFDDSIYRYVLVYCIDGKNNATIPSTCLSFDLPNGDTGPFTIVRCVGCVGLPQLDDGSHSLTVYATYECISTNGNWPAVIYDSNTVYFTINDGIPPAITNLSIINGTYQQNNLTLSFATDKATSWMGYSLDGKANTTIAGNTTLTTLASGTHSLTIYANDTVGNMGSSKTVYFNIKVPQQQQEQEPLSTTLVGATASVAVMGIGLMVLFKKRNRT